MKVIFGLFKSKNSIKTKVVEGSPVSKIPPEGIAYYPDLIKNFAADHHSLLGLYRSIEEAFHQHNLDGVSKKLKEFGVLLRDHLLVMPPIS